MARGSQRIPQDLSRFGPRLTARSDAAPRANGHALEVPQAERAVQPFYPTLLETSLPYRELSLLALAGRRTTDPAHAAHRWWARRPPSVFRGLLLAASMSASLPMDEFWKIFRDDAPTLRGWRVHDPFIGGGTSLVEAARLGAEPSGSDVDPLAVEITKHALHPPLPADLTVAGAELVSFLESRLAHLYAGEPGWTPLHYFFIHEVQCPHCGSEELLYRSLVIARGTKKNGAVARKTGVVAFCPECLTVHNLSRSDRKQFVCCGRQRLESGNFVRGRFICRKCGGTATHRQLKTASAPRRLIAVEETDAPGARRIRTGTDSDRRLIGMARGYVERHRNELDLPDGRLNQERRDSRPLSFGIERPVDFFTDRQLAVFGHAFSWVQSRQLPAAVERALILAISNALTSNNRLCGYATDYGRLAPLFSVRSYALPSLAVELNPLHPTAGRGTIRRTVQRVTRSAQQEVRRQVWSVSAQRTETVTQRFAPEGTRGQVNCVSADDMEFGSPGTIDLCLFDPPYFDYISYSELSEFYRPWHSQSDLGGAPLLPEKGDPTQSFGSALGRCLKNCVRLLKDGRLLVFTYHSSSPEAWKSLGIALDQAGLMVTGLWPVLNDAHMGHHSSEGNCEWDIAVVCRRSVECCRVEFDGDLDQWKKSLTPLTIKAADETNMQLAIQEASARFGALREACAEVRIMSSVH